MGGSLALLVLCETSKSLVLLPTFRPFLYAAPHPPYDSLMASGALYSLVAAYRVQSGGVNGRYAARALAVASVRCAECTNDCSITTVVVLHCMACGIDIGLL